MSEKQGRVMRLAIDQIESALMGFGNLVELSDLFVGARDDLIVTLKIPLSEVRRVCVALQECTRIVNSDEFDRFILASKQDGKRDGPHRDGGQEGC